MTTPLKAGVIGTGVISKEHLSFLATCPHAELVGVCDLCRAAAMPAQRYGATAAYTDFRQMLTEAKPDVVHILTPPRATNSSPANASRPRPSPDHAGESSISLAYSD